ncbi:MAG: carboxypeptidase regulatory-like domain-containing protein [Phycicoccus sp.]
MNTRPDPALEPLDQVDERILREVAELFRAADPVPAGLVDDVKFSLTVQALHAEVAELQRVGAEGVLARSEYTETQTLTFSAETVSAMVTLTPVDDATVRVDGWVTGHDGPVTVEARPTAGSRVVTARTDADGRFVLDDLARGLVRFVFRPDDTSVNPVITLAVEI